MSVLRLLLKEAWQRKGTLLLSLFAVAVATGLFVALETIFFAIGRETALQTKSLGFNIVFLHRDTRMTDFWINGFSDKDLPEDYLAKLSSAQVAKRIASNHFSARLEQRVDIGNRSVLLTGVRETVALRGRKPLDPNRIKPGDAEVGFELGRALVRRDAGGKAILDAKGKPTFEPLEVLGRKFRVARVRPKAGPTENIRVYIRLDAAQELLGKPGLINAVEALGCKCKVEGDTFHSIVKKLRKALPDTQAVVLDKTKWTVREDLRKVVGNVADIVIPVLLFVCAAWIATLSYLNVRQRREEIGLLRAVGVGSLRIAALFLGKALLVGFLGAAVGFALGSVVALTVGPGAFKLAAKAVSLRWHLLWWSLGLAPAMAVLASALPAMIAVNMDPASALRRE